MLFAFGDALDVWFMQTIDFARARFLLCQYLFE